MENQFKIRLSAASAQNQLVEAKRSVIFDVTPDLNESRSVSYDMHDPVQAPGQIMVYKKTNARRFSLTQIRLVSRTPVEASRNLAYLWILRSWTMPNFGIGNPAPRPAQNPTGETGSETAYSENTIRQLIEELAGETPTQNYLGAPPQLLHLSAYSRQGAMRGVRSLGHIRRVPVLIESLNIFYPSDIDYIPTNETLPTPMPTIMSIDLSLIEAQSPRRLTNFNLESFRQGQLEGF